MQRKLKAEIRFNKVRTYSIEALKTAIIKDFKEYKLQTEICDQLKKILIEYIKKYIIDKDQLKLFEKSQRIAKNLRSRYAIRIPDISNSSKKSCFIDIDINESDAVPINKTLSKHGGEFTIEEISKNDPKLASQVKKLVADYAMNRNIILEKKHKMFPNNLDDFTYQELMNYNKDWFDRLIDIGVLSIFEAYEEFIEEEPASIKDRLELLRKKLEE